MVEWAIDFFLYRENIGGFLLPHIVLFMAIGLLVLSIFRSTVLALLASRVSKNAADDVIQTIRTQCASCRWEGDIPKLRKVCPMCGQSNFVE
jgi:hypothetical protein